MFKSYILITQQGCKRDDCADSVDLEENVFKAVVIGGKGETIISRWQLYLDVRKGIVSSPNQEIFIHVFDCAR